MELHYVEVENWDKLWDKDHIIFKLPKKQIEYEIVVLNGVFCWAINADVNSEIFDYLNLDAKNFVKSIVGYAGEGVWPKVNSIKDLKKVIKALDDECIKKFGECNTPKFKVGDKVRILPRKGVPKDYIGTYIDEMLQFVGKITTIRSVESDFRIGLADNHWMWDPKALELVDEKEESKTININQVKINKPETQFEAELNLFPTKKHYQLNFNY